MQVEVRWSVSREDCAGLGCGLGVLRGQPHVDTRLQSSSSAVEGDGLTVRKVDSVAYKACATRNEVFFGGGALMELVVLCGAEGAPVASRRCPKEGGDCACICDLRGLSRCQCCGLRIPLLRCWRRRRWGLIRVGDGGRACPVLRFGNARNGVREAGYALRIKDSVFLISYREVM